MRNQGAAAASQLTILNDMNIQPRSFFAVAAEPVRPSAGTCFAHQMDPA
ncbi:MAG TPA: hypothetical protein VNF08_06955 [Acidimicrobiales bacterium]|nr:hypothetical protein [Acidimicrobiales bacterium]